MSKVVCPKCGGRLTYEAISQYGVKWKVKPDGTLGKRGKRVEYNATEDEMLYCESCQWTADDGDYAWSANGLELLEGVEE